MQNLISKAIQYQIDSSDRPAYTQLRQRNKTGERMVDRQNCTNKVIEKTRQKADIDEKWQNQL